MMRKTADALVAMTETDDKWQKGDGLLESVDQGRRIIFKNGFVRVRDSNFTSISEGYAKNEEEKSLDVPANHRCEVLGAAQYYFVNC